MACTWKPETVSAELISLTHSLGSPERDYVILAEGNVSQRLDDSRIVVKTSGSMMANLTAEDFVVCEVAPLVELMDDPVATQADLIAHLDAGEHNGARRRGSIETLIHIAVQSLQPTPFVGHTHPTALVALLASIHQETAFESFVYSDEAIVIGTTLYVPYAEPGITLGRLVLGRLREYWSEHGQLPSLILLGNHGVVALADTPSGVEAITAMAAKGATIRLHALAAGGVVALNNDAVRAYFDREDMSERRRNLSGA